MGKLVSVTSSTEIKNSKAVIMKIPKDHRPGYASALALSVLALVVGLASAQAVTVEPSPLSAHLPYGSQLTADLTLTSPEPDDQPWHLTRFEKALRTDGIDDYVSIPDNPSVLPNKGFTIEGWIRPGSNLEPLGGTVVISKYNYGRKRSLQISAADNRIGASIFGDHDNTTSVGVSYPNLVPDAWAFFSVTFDQDLVLRLYVDGVLVSEAKGIYPMKLSNESIYLGNAFNSGRGQDNHYQGSADEIRMWNIVRTPPEIQQDMCRKLTGAEPGLVSYWNFDDGTANNLVAGGRHGSLNRGAHLVDDESVLLPYWLQLSTTSGVVPAEGQEVISVHFDATKIIVDQIVCPLDFHLGESVLALPVDMNVLFADFAADVIAGSPPLTVQFSNQSLGGATAYTWDFGDTSTGTEMDPEHVYEKPGSYTIRLQAENAFGQHETLREDYILAVENSWFTTSGGPHVDRAHSIGQAASGNFVIGGTTTSYGEGNSDLYLMLLDPSGAVLWEKAYGTTSRDAGLAAVATRDGGFLIGGYRGRRDDFPQLFMVKTDGSGRSQWTQRFGHTRQSQCNTLQEIADGYILGGSNLQRVSGNWVHRFYLARVNASGVTRWEQNYGGNNDETCLCVQQAADGGFIAGGWTESYGAGKLDMFVVKTDAGGTALWQKPIGGPEDEACRGIAETSDGGMIAVGYSRSEGTDNDDIYIVKLDKAGEVVWEKRLGEAANEYANSIMPLADGNFLVGGSRSIVGSDRHEGLLLAIGPDGEPQWRHVFGGGQQESFTSAIQTAGGAFVAAGDTTSWGEGFGDAMILHIGGDLPLSADFTADVLAGPAPLTTQFSDLSTGNPVAWQWTFGDGGTSEMADPAYTYERPGNYTVTLIVRDADNNSHQKTIEQFIQIQPKPLRLSIRRAEPLNLELQFDTDKGLLYKLREYNPASGWIDREGTIEGTGHTVLQDIVIEGTDYRFYQVERSPF